MTDRTTKTQELKEQLENALEELHHDLEAGNSESMTRYLAAMARFPDYSFRNVLLIIRQNALASNVCGYRAWQKLGRQVRKGQKAIRIVAPMTMKKTDAAEDGETFTLFRAVSVFDILQTEGDPLPEPETVEGDPGEYRAGLQRFLESRGIELELVPDLGTALGRSHGGKIELVRGLEPGESFSVLVHETAHELLHKDRENAPPKLVRETEAEAVAFVVCSAIGLQTNHAAADYIQLHQGDAKTFTASLERIQKTAALILEELYTHTGLAVLAA